jgi:hypothetical protein
MIPVCLLLRLLLLLLLQVTGRNLLGKLARCVLTPIKEIYLPVMTWGLPTNHLMVRPRGVRGAGPANEPRRTATV